MRSTPDGQIEGVTAAVARPSVNPWSDGRAVRYGRGVTSSDRAQRIAVALPPLDERARELAVEQDWELSLLDPQDPDERAILIRLAHPDFDAAIESSLEEVEVGGQPMNPRLHLTIHEIVAAQIIDDDPAEAFTALQRLLDLGRDPHEALHMLGSAVTTQLWAAMQESSAYDRDEHIRALAALPGSWDEQLDAASRPRPVARARHARRHPRPGR